MKLTAKYSLLILLPALLTSCFKEDKMLPLPDRGNVQTDTIAMTENYTYQVYFRLDSGKVVSSNRRMESDLGFDCSGSGWKIILNTSDFMRIADLGVVPFAQPCDTTGAKWRFDKSDGNPDSLAIGPWFSVKGTDTVSNHHVYLLDRGMDDLGKSLGILQIIFDSLKNSTYYFRFAGQKGGVISQGVVNKNPRVNYLFYSLSAGGSVKHLEPDKTTYDLLFTQYTTLLFTSAGAAYPYLVTGVLTNRSGISVATDSVTAFAAITLDKARGMSYSTALDAIGYLWKSYNFDAGSYTVRNNLNYVIRSLNGFYYKLRFIGFYNKKGQKGYPVIEYQRL